jgi:hypothetical protein
LGLEVRAAASGGQDGQRPGGADELGDVDLLARCVRITDVSGSVVECGDAADSGIQA